MGLILRKNVSIIFFSTCVFVVLTIHLVSAAWTGPSEIVIGTWGYSDDQFGIQYQDTSDMFASFSITSVGKIVVRDGINKRLKIYNTSGNLESVIPYKSSRHYTELILADRYGFTGDFVGYGSDNSDYYFRADQNKYLKYSPTGELLKTYTERPLELGIIREQKIAPGQYKVTVKYPDKEWVIIGKGVCQGYVRDMNGNLYCTGDKQVVRYDDKGNEIARLTMPESRFEEISLGAGVEPMIKVVEEYGSPVVAPNGDIYTWKRTPDKYYIIKWTWQD